MSSKSKFRGLNASKFKISDKVVTPRAMEEIQKEYGQVAAQTGQLQYQIFIFEKDLAELNERLVSINKEAAARKQLDEAEAAKAVAPAVTEEEA